MALLKTVGLCKYFGGLKAVNHVDMEVQQGQVFGIIGPNGAGKTTFFNLCAGTIPATEGEIWFDGKNITGYRPHMAAKAGIARTFQNIQLFQNTTVLENVAVGFHIHTNTNMLDAVLGNAHQKNTEKEIYEKGAALLERLELGQYKDTLAKTCPTASSARWKLPVRWQFPQNSAVGRTRSRYEPERNPRAAFVCKKAERRGANGGRH